MTNYPTIAGFATLALLVAGSLILQIPLRAADSPEITNLLTGAKAIAVKLKADSEDLESFTRSTMTWRGYLSKLDVIKGHVNNTGKLLASK
jgi:hypothetical protein